MTEYYIGKRSRHSYAIEGTYGTRNPSTLYSWLGVIQSITPNSKSEFMQINAMDDVDSRNVSDYYETIRNYGGSIELYLQHCRVLMLAIGDDTLTGSSIHTLTETNILPSFTFNFGYQHGTDYHAVDYKGCVINRMDISCTKGEFVKCTAEFVAQDGEDHAFRSYQTGDAFKKYSSVGVDSITPYSYADATVTINGVEYCPDTIKMTINNNLLSEPCLNSDNEKRIAQPIPQLREYEASATIKMSTDNLYDLWESGEYATTNPVITFARTAGSDQVVFTLENAILESAISPFNINDGIVLVELPFKVTKISVVETNSIDVDYSTVET